MENLDQDFIKSTCESVDKSSNEIDEENINIMLEDREHITKEFGTEFSEKVSRGNDYFISWM